MFLSVSVKTLIFCLYLLFMYLKTTMHKIAMSARRGGGKADASVNFATWRGVNFLIYLIYSPFHKTVPRSGLQNALDLGKVF